MHCSGTPLVKLPPTDIFRVDVGGTNFAIRRSTLLRFPDTPLAKLALTTMCPTGLQDIVSISETTTFIDTNPTIFESILETYRTGSFHPPNTACAKRVQQEIQRWGIPDSVLSVCCSMAYEGSLDDMTTLKGVVDLMKKLQQGCDCTSSHGWREVRRCMWVAFEFPRRSTTGMIVAAVSYFLTLASITIMIIGSDPHFRIPRETGKNHTYSTRMFESVTQPWIYYLDFVIVMLQLVELFLRIIACPAPKCFMKLFLTWVDIFSIIPVVVGHFIYMDHTVYHPDSSIHEAVGILYAFAVLRVVRILHLARVFPGLKVISLAIYHSLQELLLLLVLVLMTALIFGTLMFYLENESENKRFPVITEAIWWAVITMTTVGYGDIYPVTPQGRILASLCAFCGLIVIVLPIPIIATNFYLFYNFFKKRTHLII